MLGYTPGGRDADLHRDDEDDARGKPKCVVVDGTFDWEGDRSPRTPWHQTVIYEAHVKGLTMRHPDVPEELRGTYAGLAWPPVIEYLQELGITALELLPVHDLLHDGHLLDKGLRNLLGLQHDQLLRAVRGLLGVGRPRRAGAGVQVDGARAAWRRHSRSSSTSSTTTRRRATISARRSASAASTTRATTGWCTTTRATTWTTRAPATSLNARDPQVIKLIMDSLRYWVLEMRVDGFRFDLASTLARELHEVDRLSSFFDTIHQDPVLSRVKLIAEPWDLGEGGYQVGNFPVLWTEWNGKYRDAVRSYWKGDAGRMAEYAYRLTGSSDLYGDDGRNPYASINFITAHDGFTLHDLVAYNEKHNEANKDGNRDGHDHNISWNHGVEGPTDDPSIIELRDRQKRNFLTTLFVSQGVPMLCGGDEIGRTQHGNNNAYCQDNELSWLNWELDEGGRALLEFTRCLIRLRRRHPALRRRKFFQGRAIHGGEVRDIIWYRPDGEEMTDREWDADWSRAVALRLEGDAIGERDELGRWVTDDNLLILMNAHHEPVRFRLPAEVAEGKWEVLVDTAEPGLAEGARVLEKGGEYEVRDRGMVVMREVG